MARNRRNEETSMNTAEENTATAPATEGTTEGGENTSNGSEGETPRKRRGVIPTMPLCAVYFRGDGKCVAAVISPRGESYDAVGKGQGSAMGELIDMGFVLSSLHQDAPQWLQDQKRIPEDARVIGYANIQGFPLPKQE